MGLLQLQESPSASYVDVHNAVILCLHMLGIKLNPKGRIDAFRLLHKVKSEYAGRAATEECTNYLTRLIQLRTQGLEPPHKNGVYL